MTNAALADPRTAKVLPITPSRTATRIDQRLLNLTFSFLGLVAVSLPPRTAVSLALLRPYTLALGALRTLHPLLGGHFGYYGDSVAMQVH
jgi:hypothetical protein